MKLQDQVCSLELARKLKKLGVPQSGAFDYYENTFHPNNPFIVLRPSVKLLDNPTSWICCAFNVSELFNLVIRESNFHWQVHHNVHAKTWGIYPANPLPFEGGDGFVEEKLADCLANLWILLLEKGIVKP